ncbi:MAG: 16S rRNA processing protein RimM [Oscillospiraceae bacterium]|nr:16S rRNA processing protein RimM [Oscillospiraceae bacterium]
MRLEFLEAGEIVTTHGVRGEMKVMPWADGPEFLTGFRRVRVDGTDYKVQSCRIQKTCNLLKLEGVNSIEEAQQLRGKTVVIYRQDAPVDLIFTAELIGVEVISDGDCIGKVTDVLDYPGNKVYEVQGAHTYLIPAVKQFIHEVDLDKNIMQVTIIEGMRTDES